MNEFAWNVEKSAAAFMGLKSLDVSTLMSFRRQRIFVDYDYVQQKRK